jgi:hypothetical protein
MLDFDILPPTNACEDLTDGDSHDEDKLAYEGLLLRCTFKYPQFS